MHPAYAQMSRSEKNEFRKATIKASADLVRDGWEHICSVMDDSPKGPGTGNTNYGMLYVKGSKREGTWKEFYLNIDTYKRLPVSESAALTGLPY